jgi:hypothetical protein
MSTLQFSSNKKTNKQAPWPLVCKGTILVCVVHFIMSVESHKTFPQKTESGNIVNFATMTQYLPAKFTSCLELLQSLWTCRL